ncbi:uncharacterized protein RJT20DRAFT_129719 [Scheffersomyces xylosifermentans]|uniref:uncharacterized protein n=1 Tax=Scheffersomyces xylosifermentans TaxID=1304137 RepID=UPI00315CF1F9
MNSVKVMVHNTTERMYNILDSILYYVMNIVMMVLLFSDLIMDFSNSFIHNYNIVMCSLKHKMYNNIN